MRMRRATAQGNGQSTMEYAIFIAVVAAALIAMSGYVRRALLANIQRLERQASVVPMQ